jgi:hypothetical protein
MSAENEARAAVCEDHVVKMHTWGFDLVSFKRAPSSTECWFCRRSGVADGAHEGHELQAEP